MKKAFAFCFSMAFFLVPRAQNPHFGWVKAFGESGGGVFVWQCIYKIEGDAKRIQKGTVTLIR